MGLFKEAVEGFTNGFVSAAVERLRSNDGHGVAARGLGRVDQLCNELGWAVNERQADGVLLHFKDATVGVRKAVITCGEKVMTFRVWSAASLLPRLVSGEIMAHLLVRNAELTVGSWHAFKDERGNVGFGLVFNHLINGMTAEMFQHICQTMISAGGDLDAKLSALGLLECCT